MGSLLMERGKRSESRSRQKEGLRYGERLNCRACRRCTRGETGRRIVIIARDREKGLGWVYGVPQLGDTAFFDLSSHACPMEWRRALVQRYRTLFPHVGLGRWQHSFVDPEGGLPGDLGAERGGNRLEQSWLLLPATQL